jgi:hypothetical protein
VPLASGRSTFEVTIAGRGRFDLGFWAGAPGAPPTDYRFTMVAPTGPRTFELAMPAPPRP